MRDGLEMSTTDPVGARGPLRATTAPREDLPSLGARPGHARAHSAATIMAESPGATRHEVMPVSEAPAAGAADLTEAADLTAAAGTTNPLCANPLKQHSGSPSEI